ALAVTPDGASVYAAGFMTGNRTVTLNEVVVCADQSPCPLAAGATPKGLPAPIENHAGVAGPATGLIVHFDAASGKWVDELGRAGSALVRFELPDHDVFQIEGMAAVPSVTRKIAGVGTVLYAMSVNPASGKLYVANTDAQNRVRFEGPGDYVRSNGLKPA